MKVIILGLDGLDIDLINNCKGIFPNLEKLMRNGCWGKSESCYPPLTGPAWTSIITGKSIANHGLLNMFSYDKDFNVKLNSPEQVKERRFYEIMHDNGIKCFLMNVPYSDPDKIEGDILDSWISKKDGLDLIKPLSLLNKFPSIKKYKIYREPMGNTLKYIQSLGEIAKLSVEIIKDVVINGDYDFMFFQISLVDWLQHRSLIDLKYKKETPLKDVSLEALKILDEAAEFVMNNLDGGHLLVLSDHGMVEKKGTMFINSWLKQEGYLTTSFRGKAVKTDSEKAKRSINIGGLVRLIKRSRFLIKLGKAIDRRLRGFLPFDLVKQAKIDYDKSVAVSLIKNVPVIRILGLSESAHKEKIKKEIIDKLLKINIIGHDIKKFYRGKYTDKIETWGDIVLEMGEYEFDTFVGDKVLVEGSTIFHGPNGIFMAYGPGIKFDKLEKISIIDFAPTILHMYGLPIPNDMEGKVLEIFDKSSEFSKRKIKHSQVDLRTKHSLDEAIRKVKF